MEVGKRSDVKPQAVTADAYIAVAAEAATDRSADERTLLHEKASESQRPRNNPSLTIEHLDREGASRDR